MKTIKVGDIYNGRIVSKIIWREKGIGEPIEKTEILEPALAWSEIQTLNPNPMTPTKRTPTYRLPSNLADEVQDRADHEGRGIANMVAFLVTEALELGLTTENLVKLRKKAEEKNTTVEKLVNHYVKTGLSAT